MGLGISHAKHNIIVHFLFVVHDLEDLGKDLRFQIILRGGSNTKCHVKLLLRSERGLIYKSHYFFLVIVLLNLSKSLSALLSHDISHFNNFLSYRFDILVCFLIFI